MEYATFWQRFVAQWVDGFVLLPFLFLFGWLEGYSKELAYLIFAVQFFFFAGYHIYCHGRFGQTVGKYAMGIRLVQLDGEKITWKQAWLRSSVDVCLGTVGLIATFITVANMSDAEYYVGWTKRMKNMAEFEPVWAHWLKVVGQVWIWSEVVVMLFNEKRRAIHDFIAGTVVVRKNERVVSPSWPQFSK
jgi:uncharacterized RDD family membrane protein YckC